jgi:hypothetical protein
MGNVEYLIALAIMLTALFTGGIGLLVTPLLVAMGVWAVWIFVGMFFIGALLYAISYVRNRNTWRGVAAAYGRDLNDLERNIDGIRTEIRRLRDENARADTTPQRRRANERRIIRLEERMADIQDRRRDLMSGARDVLET